MPGSVVAPTGALTRWVAGLIVPILASAFLILYLSPETSGARFAWQIKPGLTAMYIGAGYLGGAWLLLRAAMDGS